LNAEDINLEIGKKDFRLSLQFSNDKKLSKFRDSNEDIMENLG